MLRQTLVAFFTLMLSTQIGFAAPPPLRHSEIATGNNHIKKAWLAEPTTRYPHFVLGDNYEAANLIAETRDGTTLSFSLPQHLVFEDRHVRLADLNGDGKDEMVVVVSSVDQGAALGVFGVNSNGIEMLAQTPFIGTPNRWLNPAGIADYDGDGHLEIALVKKPHLTKRLEFWRLKGKALKLVAQMDGVSNHRLGSRQQILSATFDVDGNGVDDLIVPDGSYKNLLAISLSTSNKTIKTWPLPAPIKGNVELKTRNGKIQLVVPLVNGADHLISLQ